jgi:hypothetical protein
MKKKPQRKLLVPVDGSDRSFNTVRYIMKIDPFRHMRVILFHVYGSVPESYWDLEKDHRSTSTVRQVRAWEVRKKNRPIYTTSSAIIGQIRVFFRSNRDENSK